mmetsp:Transcript_88201/g.248219  ORF Transcript_88201/g.248219 Transcript_88201/m.248219 type:complete len:328 (-) Transcript_88201:1085-2068(-)
MFDQASLANCQAYAVSGVVRLESALHLDQITLFKFFGTSSSLGARLALRHRCTLGDRAALLLRGKRFARWSTPILRRQGLAFPCWCHLFLLACLLNGGLASLRLRTPCLDAECFERLLLHALLEKTIPNLGPVGEDGATTRIEDCLRRLRILGVKERASVHHVFVALEDEVLAHRLPREHEEQVILVPGHAILVLAMLELYPFGALPRAVHLDALSEATALPKFFGLCLCTKAIGTIVRPKQKRRIVEARGRSSALFLVAVTVAPGLPEDVGELAHGLSNRHWEARRVQVLPCLLGSVFESRATKIDEAVSFALEVVHEVAAFSVKK